jgi:four helix bundle protein
MEKQDYISKADFAEKMYQRIKSFGIRCIPVCDELFIKKSPSAKNIAYQLSRSSSSAVSNYRAARRARSNNDFFSKLSIVIEELDESIGWLEFTIDADYVPESKLILLIDEGYQLLQILAKSRKTTGELIKSKSK